MRRCEFYLSMAALSLEPLSQEQIDTGTKIDVTIFGSLKPLQKAGASDITRYLHMDLEVISDLLEELPHERSAQPEDTDAALIR